MLHKLSIWKPGFLQATEVKAKTEAKAKTAAAKAESKATTVSNKVSAVKDKAVGKLLLIGQVSSLRPLIAYCWLAQKHMHKFTHKILSIPGALSLCI